jgi:FlaG/FlaF family flagellin (archaellin)
MGHSPTLTCTTILIAVTITIAITIAITITVAVTIISATWQAGVQKLAEENSRNAVQLHFEGAQGLTVFHTNLPRQFAVLTTKLYDTISQSCTQCAYIWNEEFHRPLC